MLIRRYSWAEFDRAVRVLRFNSGLPWDGIVGIFGEPRGGLCLSVALSHHRDVPMVNHSGASVLWVDDIYDSGKTYRARGKPFYKHCAVWLRREGVECPIPYVDTLPKDAWAVFPWEDPVKAEKDMREYHAKG